MSEFDQEPLTYLVTGGAGFIGSHLTDELLGRGHQVLAIDNLSTGRMSNISHNLDNSKFHFARADIQDDVVLDRLAASADIIVHLAAAVGVQLVIEHPVHTIQTNIMGTEAVLNAALRYNCRVMVASTSEVYGKGHKIPFHEDDDVLLGATRFSRWGYAASKMVDEFLSFAYQQEHDLDVVIFRLFNTVGPRQTGRYGMVIPRFINQAIDGEDISVYGDGTQQRCFCDVRDVVRALTELSTSHEAGGKVFNIGSNEEVSIHELAQRIKEMSGSTSSIVFIPYDEAYAPGFEDMRRRVPSLERIHETVGWQPRYTLDNILENILSHKTNTI